jgi:hypothetical protein
VRNTCAHRLRGGTFSGTRLTGLRHKHIKRLQQRKLLKDAVKRARGASTTCGGINDQECTVRDVRAPYRARRKPRPIRSRSSST